jgi:hypothetical protein
MKRALKIEIVLIALFSILLASLFIIPMILYRPNGFSSSSFSQRTGEEYIWEVYSEVLVINDGSSYYAWQATDGEKITITATNRIIINSILYDTLWGLTAQNTAYNRTWQIFSSAVPLLDTYNSTFGCCPYSFCGSWCSFIPHNETAATVFLCNLFNGWGSFFWTSGSHGYDGLVTLISGPRRIEIQFNVNGVMQSWKYFWNGELQSDTELISNEFPIWRTSILLTTLLWIGITGILMMIVAMLVTIYSDYFRAVYNRFRDSRFVYKWNSFFHPYGWTLGLVFIFFVCYPFLNNFPHELGHAIVANIFGFQSSITINYGNASTITPLMLYASTTQLICVAAAGSCSSLVVAAIIILIGRQVKPVKLLCSWIALGLLLDPLLYPLTTMDMPASDWYKMIQIYHELWIVIVVVLITLVLIAYSVYTIVRNEINLKRNLKMKRIEKYAKSLKVPEEFIKFIDELKII